MAMDTQDATGPNYGRLVDGFPQWNVEAGVRQGIFARRAHAIFPRVPAPAPPD